MWARRRRTSPPASPSSPACELRQHRADGVVGVQPLERRRARTRCRTGPAARRPGRSASPRGPGPRTTGDARSGLQLVVQDERQHRAQVVEPDLGLAAEVRHRLGVEHQGLQRAHRQPVQGLRADVRPQVAPGVLRQHPVRVLPRQPDRVLGAVLQLHGPALRRARTATRRTPAGAARAAAPARRRPRGAAGRARPASNTIAGGTCSSGRSRRSCAVHADRRGSAS